ncbi:MAG: AarF/UbiB family protein, partial [Myxococcales bacterium]
VRHQVRHQVPEWLKQRRERIDLRNARRLYRDILKLRGVYIKMGQVLSVLGGFLPKAFCTELEGLQDQVPPHPFSDVERTFLADMGRRPDQVFARIVKVPIAAASLGQVHEAYLADGTKVAVKVLYPHIRDIIRIDMRVLGVVIRVYQRFLPVSNLVSVHQSLIDLLRRETDYLHEAACMERMAKNFEAEPDLLFPKVVHDLTTRDILTMTFMEGVKITRLDELERLGVNKTRVATRLIQSFYKQLFVDHYFHADPHPGNFLVQAGPNGEPRIVVLDFGAVCEASDELIEGAMEILQALFTQNGDLALKGFRRMGFAAPEGNKELIEKTIMTYFKKLLRIEHRTANALMEKGHEEPTMDAVRNLLAAGYSREETSKGGLLEKPPRRRQVRSSTLDAITCANTSCLVHARHPHKSRPRCHHRASTIVVDRAEVTSSNVEARTALPLGRAVDGRRSSPDAPRSLAPPSAPVPRPAEVPRSTVDHRTRPSPGAIVERRGRHLDAPRCLRRPSMIALGFPEAPRWLLLLQQRRPLVRCGLAWRAEGGQFV